MRRAVRRFAGCLGLLPSRQRTVLGLRAGIGTNPVSTRRRIAVRLDLSAGRVARIERRGLRGLRTLGHNGGCGAAVTATVVTDAPAGPTESASQSAVAGSSTAGAVAAGEQTGSRSAVGGAQASPSTSRDSRPIALMPLAQEEASDWSIAAVLIGVLLLGYALRREFGPSGPRPSRARR